MFTFLEKNGVIIFTNTEKKLKLPLKQTQVKSQNLYYVDIAFKPTF